MEDLPSQNKPKIRRKSLPQSTISQITPNVLHNSNSRYPDESPEGDTFEFIEFSEFTQSYPLRHAPMERNFLDDARDPQDRRSTDTSRYTGLYSSKPRFTLIAALMDWKLEAASCFLALVGALAVVATLYPFNGQPLPQWPYGLSINSLISIYIAVIKAAMYIILAQGGLGQLKWTWFGKTRPLDHLETFDSASRGPIGAAKLLWVLRGRDIVTTIGALVTIFAIALDPFAQLLTRYYTCTHVVTGSQAFIPKTNFYDNTGGIVDGPGTSGQAPSLKMDEAVNAGIYSGGSNRIAATCPTGDCMFPEPYKTIAYCSSCSDITSQLQVKTSNGTLQSNSTLSFNVLSVYRANLTLPSGLGVDPFEGQSFTIESNVGVGPFGSSTVIQAILAADPTDLTCSAEWPWGCTGIGAVQCQISTCIKSFTGSVQAGTLTEAEIQGEQDTSLYSNGAIWGMTGNITSPGGQWGIMEPGLISTIDLTCLNSSEKAILRTAGYQFNETSQWLAYNASMPAGMSVAAATALGWAVSANSTILDINASCIYQTTWDAQLVISSYLSMFDGNATNAGPNMLYSSSDVVGVVFNEGNVSASTFASIFQNITDSMTTTIRLYTDAYTPNNITGLVLDSETCVDVRWGWLTFPCALLLLTLVFFVAMVIQTRTRDAIMSGSRDYKTSTLPLLFHGLEASTALKFGLGTQGMAKMSQDAKDLHVVLRATDAGWKFVSSLEET